MATRNEHSFYQHTLAHPIHVIGRGLHSGKSVSMTLLPASADTGYVFERQDVHVEKGEVTARWNNVTDTRLSTTVSNSFGVRVSTIEHLLSALRGMDIDNCRILIDGPEVPILDGSAQPFVELIAQHGVQILAAERRAILIKKSVWLHDQHCSAGFQPFPVPWIDMHISFDNPAIGVESLSMPINRQVFQSTIAAARTFGLAEEIETLQKHGLALGGSLKNAILVGNDGVINKEGLRYENEFVRHKFLDAVGDLALAGAPIIGRFVGNRSGHRMNNDLLRQLMLEQGAWTMTTFRQMAQQKAIHSESAQNHSSHSSSPQTHAE